MSQEIERTLQRYIEYYENISPDNVEELREMAVSNMHFKDPFNEVWDLNHVVRIMKHMFETSTEVKFNITDYFLKDRMALLKWDFVFRAKSLNKGQPIKVVGVSEVCFDESGLITDHVDYWDPAEQLYEYIPLVGSLLRAIKKKLKVD